MLGRAVIAHHLIFSLKVCLYLHQCLFLLSMSRSVTLHVYFSITALQVIFSPSFSLCRSLQYFLYLSLNVSFSQLLSLSISLSIFISLYYADVVWEQEQNSKVRILTYPLATWEQYRKSFAMTQNQRIRDMQLTRCGRL